MAKYIVNVGPISNSLSDPYFFIGTGFWGEEINTHEELKSILKQYWRDKKTNNYRPFKLTFSLGENIAKAKSIGNKQASEGKTVNMFSVLGVLCNDPFRGKKLYFSGYGFKGHEDSHWMLVDKDEQKTFFPGEKLSQILPKLGIILG